MYGNVGIVSVLRVYVDIIYVAIKIEFQVGNNLLSALKALLHCSL